MKGEDQYTIKKAGIYHLPVVKEIELECGLSSWSPADYLQELKREDSFFYICKSSNKTVGFILARLIMNQISVYKINDYDLQNNENKVEIYNIGIRNRYKRKGIGTFLFNELLEKSRRNNVKKMWLEVRVSNTAAICFYESKGFEITGRRKSLYINPAEDGFVMCLNV